MIHCHAAKKYLSVAACFVFLLAGIIAIPRFLTPDHDNQPNIMTPGSDIITVSSSEELADTVGFEVEEIAKLPFKMEETIYTSYGGDLGAVEK